MTDFLFPLAKVNLAMAGAILAVGLLRRPVRAAFHAPLAYALWLLVPASALASLLPPRVVVATVQPVKQFFPQALPVRLPAATAQTAPFDASLLLCIGWLAGMGAMTLFLIWQQRRFHQLEKQGAAGPAVTGFWRPRIVVPATFAAQFSAAEQAAILAHEAAHLARQDARVNAVVAALRCINWFNPFVHLGAVWLRKDQELACDAAALKHVKRTDYANALLKSQMRASTLPLGCAWPGSEHPLTERVTLLKRAQPTAPQRRAGVALITLLILCGGAGAWAAQPAQTQIAQDPTAKHDSDKSSECPKSTGFCGKFLYAQRIGDSGPAFFLALESERRPDQVVMHYPYGMAQAERAHMDLRTDQDLADHKTIVLSGNVRVADGLNFLHGQKLEFDARTGMLDLDGKQIPSGMPKYTPCTKGCMEDGKPVK
jgi:beta-lactamase regulating signal transducer with metallopeptidase domain